MADPEVILSQRAPERLDNEILSLGTDRDGVLVNLSAALAANTSRLGVLGGTPVVPALAADTLVIANQAPSGDVLIAANRAGNAEASLWVDSSARQTRIYGGGVLGLTVDGSASTITASLALSTSGINITIADDDLLGIGTGNTARFSWDTTDANANALLLQLPAGGAVDVPVLAIGQSIESVDLGLFTSVVDPTIAIFGVGAVTTGPRLRVYKARGTIASPTVVTTGDDLFSIDAYGAVAAGEYVQAARILFEMTGTIATTRGPGVITFQTATDAAPSVLTTALTLNANQTATFGSTIATTGVTSAAGITLTPTTDVFIANNTGLVIGHTAQIQAAGVSAELQVLGSGQADSQITIGRFTAANAGAILALLRSPNAAVGSHTSVADNDFLGEVIFLADDGTTWDTIPARFMVRVDDPTPATGDIGAEFVWDSLPGAAGARREVMTLNAAGNLDLPFTMTVGTAGTRTGTIGIDGATSGTVTLTVAAAAGTWTMQLPAAVGAAGNQLTDAAGDGVTSWGAASLGEWKNDLGILDPHEALAAVVQAPTHKFTYNKDVLPPGWSDGNGFEFYNIFAEEAPWAMYGPRDGYRSGVVFSTVNAFGYARAAIEALYNDFQDALQEIIGLRQQVAVLQGG